MIAHTPCGVANISCFGLSTSEPSIARTLTTLKSEAFLEVYIGVQAFDTSKNASELSVGRVRAIGVSDVDKPKQEIVATPQGVWAIKVYLDCPPDLDNIKAVEIYRDGETRIAALIFDKGKRIQWVDPVGYEIGLTHTYTYRYITYDNRVSSMSYPSQPCTADVIDMSYINQEQLKQFNDAWSKEGLKALESLRKNRQTLSDENKKIVDQLDKVKTDYSDLVSNYKLLVKDFQQLSAQVEQDEKTIKTLRTSLEQTSRQVSLKANQVDMDAVTGKVNSQMENRIKVTQEGIDSAASRIEKVQKQLNLASDTLTEVDEAFSSQIKQNAQDITLRAVKGDIDSATEQMRQQVISQINLNEAGITSIVSKAKDVGSSITQLNNSISLCVQSNGLQASVTAAVQKGFSTTVIKADRVVVNGECLLQGNARCVGRWSSNTFSIVDPRTGRPIWGSDTGTVQPQTVTFEHHYGGDWSFQWVGGNPDWRNVDWVQFTPKPPAIFNGVTTTKVSISGYLLISPAQRDGGTLGNNPCLGLYVYDTNGDQQGGQNNNQGFANVSNSPIAIVDKRGVCKVKNMGSYISYVDPQGVDKGYKSSSRSYYWKLPFTISWEKPLTVGRKTMLCFAVKVLRRDEYNPLNVAVQNCRWTIKCY